MKKGLGLLIALLLPAMPAAAQKVYIDYDKDANFGSYKTFAWAPTPETSVADTSPLMDSRIRNAIEYWLTNGGMREVTEAPDLFVTYHTDEKQEMSLNTTSFGYGYGAGWYYGGMGGTGAMGGMGSASGSTTSVNTYTQGTLIIDAWDAAVKKLVWRGTATATVPENPEKGAAKIDKAVKKIAQKWRKMYEKDKKSRGQ